ncbi:MAG: chromosomal replication initiator protein DnaA [Candidatus Lernaella stagnicola]|nr:chromosomal replication initiator protein DnaA [Candidatus Lernaella stagnicola]
MDLWNRTCDVLSKTIDAKNFTAWIQPLRQAQANQSFLRLSAPNKVVRSWFIKHYLKPATAVLTEITGRAMTIEVGVSNPQMSFDSQVILPKDQAKKTAESPKNGCRRTAKLPNDQYTFENFVVGPSNEFAYAAAKNVAKNPGQGMNPLFIYGGTGLGKTHLLNAVGHRLLRRDSETRLVMVSAERFMNELIGAIQGKRTGAFHRKYRNLDALLIDDIQTIAGKNATQEEFFHTFNTLYENGAQIVLASDQYPRDIPMLEERLCSRFGMGMIADIQVPELETRMAIIRKKALAEKIKINEDVTFYVASRITNNVRELEGALRRIAAYSELHGGKVELDIAKRALRHIIGDPDKPIAVEQVQKTVCEYFNIKQSEMLGARRHKAVAQPRQVAMYLSRKLTNHSFPDIGRKFGGRDHTTVMHAVRKMETQSQVNPELLSMLETLEKTLRNK